MRALRVHEAAVEINDQDGLLVGRGLGDHLGLAFQAIDDILDVTQSSEQLGKSPGKDAAAGKTTYPALLGLEESKKEAARLTEKALGSLSRIGERADTARVCAWGR